MSPPSRRRRSKKRGRNFQRDRVIEKSSAMQRFWHKSVWLLSSPMRAFILTALVLSFILIGMWYFWPREPQPTCSGNFDLVVVGAEIIDGLGGPPFTADIGIRDKRIACLGSIHTTAGQTVVHADGLTVAPGFVDVHTHIERNVATNSSLLAANFIHQGVTTIITGNCGRSFLNIGELFKLLETSGSDVNVASLIGHNTIRVQVMKQSGEAPTGQQLDKMKSLAKAAMRDGALGLSTGLEYVPGTFATTDEIVELAKAVGESGGIYASHIRDEGPGGEKAIREAISVGDRARVHVHISHFKAQGPHQWGSAQRRLDIVKRAEDKGLRVSIDQYPYTASSTGLAILLPSWLSEGGLKLAKQKLTDSVIRKRVRDEMLKQLQALGWQDYSFAKIAYCESDRSLVGLTITEVSHRRQEAQSAQRQAVYAPARFDATPRVARSENEKELEREADTVIDLYSHGGAQMVFFNMSEDDVETIMKNPDVMFGSDSGVREDNSSSLPHPRGLGTFPRILGVYARQKGLFSIEEAIRRMTSLPATTFGLKNRGQIREGYWADLVVFDRNRILDTATYEKPLSIPKGIDYVIVNGSIILEHGVVTRSVPGMAIRHDAGTHE